MQDTPVQAVCFTDRESVTSVMYVATMPFSYQPSPDSDADGDSDGEGENDDDDDDEDEDDDENDDDDDDDNDDIDTTNTPDKKIENGSSSSALKDEESAPDTSEGHVCEMSYSDDESDAEFNDMMSTVFLSMIYIYNFIYK